MPKSTPITDSVDEAVEGRLDELPPPPPGKSRDLSWAWLAAPVMANLADAASTQYALSKGMHESNPRLKAIASDPLKLYATKAALGLASSLGAKLAAKHLGKGVGKAIIGGATAVPTGAAITNTLNAKKQS